MSAVRTLAPPAPEGRPFPVPARLRLRRRVLALDYAGCTKLVCRLLEAIGYEEARPAGRTALLGYNRPGGGGWDIAATLPAGIGARCVIVRLKHSPRHYSGPDPEDVHQRCVDELRGACLRAGASEGLIVTTAGFSRTARRLAAKEGEGGCPGVAPVHLVDGEELVDLLLANRLGVREVLVFPGVRRLEMDEGFFHVIRSRATQGADAARPARPGDHLRENVRRENVRRENVRRENVRRENVRRKNLAQENLRRLASLRVVVRLGGDDADPEAGHRRRGRPGGSR